MSIYYDLIGGFSENKITFSYCDTFICKSFCTFAAELTIRKRILTK